MNHDCPFCSPLIRDHIFIETSGMMAVYNIAPILPGHSMAIPKSHVESIYDLSKEDLEEFFSFSRKVTKLLITFFNSEGFDWSLQESDAAGQSIAHVHLHIIPRKSGDLKHPGDWFSILEKNRRDMIDNPLRQAISNKEVLEMVSSLKSFIG